VAAFGRVFYNPGMLEMDRQIWPRNPVEDTGLCSCPKWIEGEHVEAFEEKAYQPFPSFKEWAEATFLSDVFDRYAADLNDVRGSADHATLAAAIETATRWAAIETGAIEGLYEVDRGFTFTVAVEAATLENIHAIKGEKTARAIADALHGYEYVLDAATNRTPLSEVWVRQLHEVLCASQETYTVLTAVGPQQQKLPKGEYKTYPNNPLNLGNKVVHGYAPVADTPPEMHRLMTELRSELFSEAHPVLQASYAHYAFVCIHPFADGNGRVSRALGSVFLYRNPGIPLVIFADQKNTYIDALEAADRGSYGPFVQFVADVATDSIQLIRAQMRKAARRELADRLRTFEEASTGRGGLEHLEVDEIAMQVLQVLQQSFQVASDNFSLPSTLKVSVASVGYPISKAPGGYRLSPDQRVVLVTAGSAEPAKTQIQMQYGVAVARPEVKGADYVVFEASNRRIVAEIFLREVYPTVSGSLHYRLDVITDDELVSVVDKVISSAQELLIRKGYTA
jgi:Fic family protein